MATRFLPISLPVLFAVPEPAVVLSERVGAPWEPTSMGTRHT